MIKPLEIGEEVIMFKVDDNENQLIDFINCLVYQPYRKAVVTDIQNVLSCNIVTVLDECGLEYCGTHVKENHLGRIRFARRDEYVKALKNLFIKVYGYDNYYPELNNILRAINRRINRVCNHLFVKLKEGYTCPGFHSSDYEHVGPRLCCVHCGLTNRYEGLPDKYLTRAGRLEIESFDEYMERHSRDIQLISEKAYNFIDPMEVYKKAKELKPEASNEELFEIMVIISEDRIKKEAREVGGTQKTKEKTGVL